MLLDTHVWIWIVTDDRRIGPRARRRLAREAAGGRLHVSAASAFEIAALVTAGRLGLNQSAERWVRDSIDRAGFRVRDLDPAIGIDAGAIPASAVPDLLDRWLVATARALNVPLVTCDRALLAYASRSKTLTTLDARS